MGMQLPEMRQFAVLPPEQRLQQGLAGAHLPARGFYRVKTADTSHVDGFSQGHLNPGFQPE